MTFTLQSFLRIVYTWKQQKKIKNGLESEIYIGM